MHVLMLDQGISDDAEAANYPISCEYNILRFLNICDILLCSCNKRCLCHMLGLYAHTTVHATM